MSKLYNEIRDGKIRPIGTQVLCNFGGLCIYYLNSDSCISGFDFGEGVQGIRETSIHYTTSGRAYIIRYQKAYYFDEIMRL